MHFSLDPEQDSGFPKRPVILSEALFSGAEGPAFALSVAPIAPDQIKSAHGAKKVPGDLLRPY